MKLNELSKKISEHDLDAYIGTENSRYLSGTPASKAVIVTPEKSILLCSRLDFDRAKNESEISDVRAVSRSEVPLRENENVIFGGFSEALAEIIKEINVEKVGFDKLGLSKLQELRDNTKAIFEESSDIVWDLRKIKTKEEINFLKKSAEIGMNGIKKASELIEVGRSEIEIATEVEYEMRKSLSEGVAFDTIVAAGSHSWLPHSEPTEKELSEGELVTIDLGARWRGYHSDMTRTFGVNPDSEQEEILEVAREAQESAISVVEPGIRAKDVDEAARKVVREAGYEECFLHGSGHGVGLDIHEPPSLAPSSEDVLEEGNVITVEPGIYVREVGGARFEEMVLVTSDGCEILTK